MPDAHNEIDDMNQLELDAVSTSNAELRKRRERASAEEIRQLLAEMDRES